MTAHANLVAGKWVSSPEANRNLNPSDLDDLVGEYARADAAQAREAIAAAHGGAGAGPAATCRSAPTSLDRIGTEILARKDELGTLLSREEGKTLPEGIGEAARAGHIFKFFAGEALRLAGEKLPSVRPGVDVEVTREPLGVVGIITPWNFPIAIPGLEDRAGARLRQLRRLQAGRPGAGLRLGAGRDHQRGRAARRRVQPRDGPRLGGRRGARQLARASPAISFTGSVETGRAIAQAVRRAHGARCSSRWAARTRWSSLDDADLAMAVELRGAGRVLLDRPALHGVEPAHRDRGIHDRFVAAMIERLKAAQGRRRAQARAPTSARWSIESQLEQDLRLHRRSARGRRARWPSAASG